MNTNFTKLKEALDELYHGIHFKINDDTNFTMEFWTDTAGQDVYVDIDFDGTVEDLVKEFSEYADRYDPDEEANYYVGSLGQRGVSSSIRTLLEDMEEVKETLAKIAKVFNEALNKTDDEEEREEE